MSSAKSGAALEERQHLTQVYCVSVTEQQGGLLLRARCNICGDDRPAPLCFELQDLTARNRAPASRKACRKAICLICSKTDSWQRTRAHASRTALRLLAISTISCEGKEILTRRLERRHECNTPGIHRCDAGGRRPLGLEEKRQACLRCAPQSYRALTVPRSVRTDIQLDQLQGLKQLSAGFAPGPRRV